MEIFLPQPPECLNCRCELAHLATSSVFKDIVENKISDVLVMHCRIPSFIFVLGDVKGLGVRSYTAPGTLNALTKPVVQEAMELRRLDSHVESCTVM